ncbi:hypothetical protein KRR40_21030 [Niabella defluvii]|nr:hypothetical protein KRR40_21030 [Niabella sp. I65]
MDYPLSFKVDPLDITGIPGCWLLVALFLWLLDAAIHFRFSHPWLLYFLPLAGVFIHFLYKYSGKRQKVVIILSSTKFTGLIPVFL